MRSKLVVKDGRQAVSFGLLLTLIVKICWVLNNVLLPEVNRVVRR